MEGPYIGGRVGVQATGYKIGTRMCSTMWEIQPIFCHNYKWNVTFKNCIKII